MGMTSEAALRAIEQKVVELKDTINKYGLGTELTDAELTDMLASCALAFRAIAEAWHRTAVAQSDYQTLEGRVMQQATCPTFQRRAEGRIA